MTTRDHADKSTHPHDRNEDSTSTASPSLTTSIRRTKRAHFISSWDRTGLSLEELERKLESAEVDADGELMQVIAAHPDITHLTLAAQPVTDLAVGAILTLSELRVIDIGGTCITDEGLLALAALESLEQVVVRDVAWSTRTTVAGRRRLRELRPQCAVVHAEEATRALRPAEPPEAMPDPEGVLADLALAEAGDALLDAQQRLAEAARLRDVPDDPRFAPDPVHVLLGDLARLLADARATLRPGSWLLSMSGTPVAERVFTFKVVEFADRRGCSYPGAPLIQCTSVTPSPDAFAAQP